MTDLKQEIARIENESYNVRFAEIIKIAYRRNELLNLLSGFDEYIYNSNGNLWLRPNNEYTKWGGPFVDDIDIRRLTNILNDVYKELNDIKFKSALVEALSLMINGTPLQVYYATCVYCQLASLEAGGCGGLSNFSDWVHDYSFVEDLNAVMYSSIQSQKSKLTNSKLKNIGVFENVYSWCLNCSEELRRYGFAAITEK